MRQFLRGLFGIDMLVYRRKTGHVAWTPAPRGASGARAIPKRPHAEATEEAVERPPERSIAVVTVHMGGGHQPVHLEDRLLPRDPTPEELPDWALQPLAPTSHELFEGAFEPPEDTPPMLPELDEPADNVIRLVPKVGQERRGCNRHDIETRVHFRLNATTLAGTVVDISETGMRITTDERRMPRIGDLLACRYPIAELADHHVRLVGKVVRQDGEDRPGFAIALLRIDDRGMPGAFEAHIGRLP